MLNLLFWNLASNKNEKVLKEIIRENSIDISILAEYKSTDVSLVVAELNNEYCLYSGYGACDKIVLIARRNAEIFVRREQNRYTLYSCNINNCSYIIAGIHLPAKPYADAEQRKNVIRDLVKDINELEVELKNSNTIVVGDFNASPFDDELIQKDTFNAVLYKDLILKADYITVNGKRYRRFYNPMINYVSENPRNYGSIYYSSGMNSLYWFCYDQVIVRKPLVDLVIDVRYCQTIGNRSLLSNFAPNSRISDHLPLMVRFEGMVQHG